MGFDVVGLRPVNEDGKYFGNNVWWWHPLWSFVCVIGEDILTEEQKRVGHGNNGVRVNKKTSLEITKRLRQALEHPDEYEDMLKESERRALEHGHAARELTTALGVADAKFELGWENVAEFTNFCESCGGFKIL